MTAIQIPKDIKYWVKRDTAAQEFLSRRHHDEDDAVYNEKHDCV